MTVVPSSRASVLLSSGGSDGRRKNWWTSVRCTRDAPPGRLMQRYSLQGRSGIHTEVA